MPLVDAKRQEKAAVAVPVMPGPKRHLSVDGWFFCARPSITCCSQLNADILANFVAHVRLGRR